MDSGRARHCPSGCGERPRMTRQARRCAGFRLIQGCTGYCLRPMRWLPGIERVWVIWRRRFMIEPIMYFGIGLLVAALIGLVVVPLVHGRAVRLTVRRLEAATPLSMAEIQADKDQLRAEFAMSTRRLEMSVEQLKNKSTGQLAELGKKNDVINRLKIELGEKAATIFALEARDKGIKDQLRATEDELEVKTSNLRETERNLADKEAELAKASAALSETSATSDSQRVELVALKTQVDNLKD